MNKKLYFAYGMNTNRNEMHSRCIDAVDLGAAVLENYQFCFRIHADIERSNGCCVQGVLWEISDRDEASLDILEGYPDYYTKIQVQVQHQGQLVTAMAYVMTDADYTAAPSAHYFTTVAEGTISHGNSINQLITAATQAGFDYTPYVDASFKDFIKNQR